MADEISANLTARRVSTLLLFLLLLPRMSVTFEYQEYLESRLLPQDSYVVEGDLMLPVVLPISRVDRRNANPPLCGSNLHIAALELVYGFR